MLRVDFICIGKLRERFYIDAFAEYAKRLGAYCQFRCVEIPEQRLTDRPSPAEIQAALNREAQDILKAIPGDAYAVARQAPALLPDRRFLWALRRGEDAGRSASEHVENDVSAPPGENYACRTALQGV